jgi:D-tyrosyl-tRNA(Tyr) deacylase
MRVVLQRVTRAQVSRVDVSPPETAKIDLGLVLLTGFQEADSAETLRWMAEKCSGLRIFEDDDGVKNRSVLEVGGAVLVVPNFTLYGDTRRGRRPSYTNAAAPELAQSLFEGFLEQLSARQLPVQSGFFQTHMQVDMINDGPVTLFLER